MLEYKTLILETCKICIFTKGLVYDFGQKFKVSLPSPCIFYKGGNSQKVKGKKKGVKKLR